MPEHLISRARPRVRLLALLAAAVLVGGIVYWVGRDNGVTPGLGVATLADRLTQSESLPRDRRAYEGLGAWVDGFDFGPAYQTAHASPPVSPRDIDAMAAAGVKTLFVQAVRDDKRSPGGIVHRGLVAEMLVRAHRHGMRVVGWYLPRFVDVDTDVANVRQIAEFRALGHQFDGVAVDIEAVHDVPDVADRNQRLIELSTRVRAFSGRDALGAIVLPPVLTEVVNEQFWPSFPWHELRPFYDVWLPMSYWTLRLTASGYHDGYTYNDESTRRLRNDLGDPNAVVHAIGGIADKMTVEELDRFAQSLVDDRAIGGSIYDWNTMSAAAKSSMTQLFGTGIASRLPRSP